MILFKWKIWLFIQFFKTKNVTWRTMLYYSSKKNWLKTLLPKLFVQLDSILIFNTWKIKYFCVQVDEDVEIDLDTVDDSTQRGLYSRLARVFQTYQLWVEEPLLHDAKLYLPSLPPPYKADRLLKVFQTDQVINIIQSHLC